MLLIASLPLQYGESESGREREGERRPNTGRQEGERLGGSGKMINQTRAGVASDLTFKKYDF